MQDHGNRKLAVIVVNWNGAGFIGRCIESLLHQTREPDVIVVVDNASSDASVDLLRTYGSRIRLTCLDRNLGFAAANNLAIGLLDGIDLVALLNPDAFAEPDWLEALETAASSNDGCASFASMMVQASNSGVLDCAGDSYHCFGHPLPRGANSKITDLYLRDREVFSASAGAALYRRDALMAAGGFDEDLFCYLEDVDLGFRLRLLGHKCLYVHRARVSHVGSGTTGRKSDFVVYHSSRNLVWVFVKNMPLLLLLLFALPHVTINFLGTLKYAGHGQLRSSLRGRIDGIKGLRNTWRKRRAVQSTRNCGTFALLKAMSWLWR